MLSVNVVMEENLLLVSKEVSIGFMNRFIYLLYIISTSRVSSPQQMNHFTENSIFWHL